MRICQLILLLTISFTAQSSELECLAKNIYFESRGEPQVGQFLVAFVTINRVKDDRWPNTICDVVYQHKQFSWTQDKYPDKIRDKTLYKKIKTIARTALNISNTKAYGFFFKRKDIKSKFFNKRQHILTVANHSFYK